MDRCDANTARTQTAARHGRAGTSATDAQISGGLSNSANGPSGGTSASFLTGVSEYPNPPVLAGAWTSAAKGIE